MLFAAVLEKNVYVVADEIYEHINFSGTVVLVLSQVCLTTITVNGVAKAFAMTGYRIGCIDTRILH
jgi:aspartate aminotransferase